MNHRTPAEDFRARLAALSRDQLEQAMHYLRGACGLLPYRRGDYPGYSYGRLRSAK